jgi:hypothetical protein
MRRFHLINPDPGNPAAAELIGEGVVFSEGTTAVSWSGVSVEISQHDPGMIAHGQNLEVVWLDADPRTATTTVRPLRILGEPRG